MFFSFDKLFLIFAYFLLSLAIFSWPDLRLKSYIFAEISLRMDNDSVKDNIRNFRRNLRVTQSEMADKLGISRTAYRNLENGDTRLFNENLDRIAEIFHIGTEELVLGYHPVRPAPAADGPADPYPGQIADIFSRHKAEVDSLTAEISRLRQENADLRQHIEAQQDLIKTKSELIVMLKKLASR